tara:strand:+ start:808 stop:1407 length:600 start_codon:yes stop_codon:yes gene_type:complete
MNENNILGVVLAGGKSSRFGSDKAKAKIAGKTLIEHTISKLENEFKEILVISNNKNLYFRQKKIFTTPDIIEGHLGPLIGVLSAMIWAKKNNYNWIFTFPCDTPLFNKKIIFEAKNEIKNSPKNLLFIKSGGKRHNIFGIWSIKLIDNLKKDVESGTRKVEDWADKMNADILEIKEDKKNNFLNINSLEELKKAEKFYE